MKHFLLFLVSLSFFSCTDHVQNDSLKILSGADTTILPGHDFYKFVNGKWLETKVTDNGVSSFSVDAQMKVSRRVNELLDRHIADSLVDDPVFALFQLFTDQAKREATSMQALQNEISYLLPDTASLEWTLAEMLKRGYYIPLQPLVYYTDSVLYIQMHPGYEAFSSEDAFLMKASANLPEEKIASILNAYGYGIDDSIRTGVFSLIGKLNNLSHYLDEPGAASASMRPVQSEFSLKKMGLFIYPGMTYHDWYSDQQHDALNRLVSDHSKEEWRGYFHYRIIMDNLPILDSMAFAEIQQWESRIRLQDIFRMHARTVFQWHLANEYEDKFVGVQHTRLVNDMISNIRDAYREGISNSSMLDDRQKSGMLAHLDSMKFIYKMHRALGDEPIIVQANLLAAVRSLYAQKSRKEIGFLSAPPLRMKYLGNPFEYNISYSYSRNCVIVSFPFLMDPLLDPFRDPSLNYGALGTYISHEIGHGFDDFSFSYRLMKPFDSEVIQSRRHALVTQYNGYELAGVGSIDGELTLDENIGDILGMEMALNAFVNTNDFEANKRIGGFGQLQCFFISRAYVERKSAKAGYFRRKMKHDPHTLPSIRINGTFRNLDQFYEIFGIGETDSLYLHPMQRISFW